MLWLVIFPKKSRILESGQKGHLVLSAAKVFFTRMYYCWEFPSCPVVRLCFPMQGAVGWILIRKLGSHMPRGSKKNKTKLKHRNNIVTS